jgi:hypothetical protein
MYGAVEKVRSSLLKKLFSTILKLTPLQKDVWSVFGKDLPAGRAFGLIELPFSGFSTDPVSPFSQEP